MRNLPAVLFLALAACGGGSDNPTPDSAPTPDAPPPDTGPPPPDSQVLDTSCSANPTPTTAAAMVTASGAANSLDISLAGGTPSPTIEGLPEADIEVCLGDCENADLLDTTTSAMEPCGQTGCEFTTAAIDTPNDMPLDAYLKVSKTTFRTTNIFPAEPIRADLMNVPAIVMTTGAFNLLAQFVGDGHTAGNGALILVVTDCALTPVQGATLTVTQNGTAVGNAPVDAGAFADELAGTFLVFNVPPGLTTVGASVNGTTLRAHDIQVFADETSATQVTPGFAAP